MTCKLYYQQTRQWMFFFLMSFVLLFFLSPDSYVRQVFGRLDSAMFFTQGHAWLKGMVPYVDFTDSKGPLLLAIYALGAWLSPTTYHGVFWISVVVYTLIFFFLYHAARLLLDDHDGHRALAATILCVWGGCLFPIIHVETRAEDFGTLFISASLWAMLRLAIVHGDAARAAGPITRQGHDNALPFFLLGISLGATFLIKYTFTAMMMLLWLVAYVAVVRQRHSTWWQPLLWTALGALLVIMPFLIYFLVEGNLHAFVQSYFLNTIATVGNIAHGHVPPSAPWEVRQLIGGRIVMLLLLAAATVPYIIMYKGAQRFLPSLLALGFWLLASVNYIHVHYMQICAPLLLFGTALIVRRRPRWPLIATLSLLTVVGNGLYQWHHYRNYIGQESAERTVFDAYAAVVNGHPGCRILFWHCLGNALGVGAEAVPACRDWFWQAGATPQMELAQDEAVYSRDADFVVVPNNPRRLRALEERGYRRVHPEITSNLILFQRK